MQNKLQELRTSALEAISKAKNIESLEELENSFLGRKGELTLLLKGIKDLSVDEKKVVGKMANEFKNELEEALLKRAKELADAK